MFTIRVDHKIFCSRDAAKRNQGICTAFNHSTLITVVPPFIKATRTIGVHNPKNAAYTIHMKTNKNSTPNQNKIRVYYDAACPVCRKDRKRYDQVAGKDAVEWCDITGNDEQLIAQGIDPKEAMIKLHVQNPEGVITSDIEAYVLLFSEIWWLKPLAWFLDLRWIKEIARSIYRKWVLNRLKKDGRLDP